MENKFINTSNIPLMLTIKETAHNNLRNFMGSFWELLKPLELPIYGTLNSI